MNLASIDLNLLLVFEALFEEGGVTAAGRRIGLGQPGMSAALARLRGLLDDELFVRAGGAMRPTAKAKALAPGIGAALAELRRTLEAQTAFDPARASRAFTIGTTDYTAMALLPGLVELVRTEAPGLDLRLAGYEKPDVGERIERGELDVAIGVFPRPPERAVVTPLYEERFVGLARAGHPAFADGPPDATRFASLPQALVTTGRDARGYLDAALGAAGLARRVAVTLPYFLVLPATLAASDLVAAVPSRLAARLASEPGFERRLFVFELPVSTPPWTVSMIWAASARKDRALAWLRTAIGRSIGTRAGERNVRHGG